MARKKPAGAQQLPNAQATLSPFSPLLEEHLKQNPAERDYLLRFPREIPTAERKAAKEKLNKEAAVFLDEIETAKSDTHSERLAIWNRAYEFLRAIPRVPDDDLVGCLPWRIAMLMRREAEKLRGECLRHIPDPGQQQAGNRCPVVDQLGWFIEWSAAQITEISDQPKKRGRRSKTKLSDSAQARAAEMWQTGRWEKCDIAKEVGGSVKDVDRAIERARKQTSRRTNKRQAN